MVSDTGKLRSACSPWSVWILFVAALAWADHASAQNSVGLRVGGSWSQLSGSSLVTSQARLGLAAAAFARIHLSDSWALQAEAGFGQRGIKDADGNLTARLSLDYAQFPLLLQYVYTQDGQSSQFYVGGSANKRVGCSIGVAGDGVDVSVDCDSTDPSTASIEVADLDITWILGVGWQASVLEWAFLFDIRGEIGQSAGVVVRSGTDVENNRNLALIATVGVSVPWGR